MDLAHDTDVLPSIRRVRVSDVSADDVVDDSIASYIGFYVW